MKILVYGAFKNAEKSENYKEKVSLELMLRSKTRNENLIILTIK